MKDQDGNEIPADAGENVEPQKAPPAEPPLQDKRLVALQSDEVARQSPLLHTDSGFDEQMVEELELPPPAPPVGESKDYPSQESDNSHTDEQTTPPAGPETPASFYTPMATPGERLSAHLLDGEQRDHEHIDEANAVHATHEKDEAHAKDDETRQIIDFNEPCMTDEQRTSFGAGGMDMGMDMGIGMGGTQVGVGPAGSGEG